MSESEKPRIGRPPSCECGECRKCRNRIKAREKYQSLSREERKELMARRDPDVARRNDRRRYYRDPEKRKEANKRWRSANQERASFLSKRWRANNPEKRRAHSTTWKAILKGDLVPEPCESCGESRAQAHHDDYSKPLEVRWLCVDCHAAHHRQYPEDAQEVA